MTVVAPDLKIESMTDLDWPRVAEIYRVGIATGHATFETEVPAWEQWDAGHLRIGRLVCRIGGKVVGWAALAPVSRRACYAGVAEASVYVAASHRRLGLGRSLLLALIAESERAGIWTLQGATFPENEASLRLQQECGFRIIGCRERVARHNGVWRDTVLTERRSRIVGTDT
jgi:phosphinothricin acetyltransferase